VIDPLIAAKLLGKRRKPVPNRAKGGLARAAALTPEQRRAIGRKGGQATQIKRLSMPGARVVRGKAMSGSR
jgi:general stress protein YciG